MDISIVPEILNSERISFRDLDGNPIDICEKSQFLFNYASFKKPLIVIDLFERKKYKRIEIRRIGIDQVEKLGYRIISLRTTSKIRNRPRQTKSYALQLFNSPVYDGQILMSIPIDHSVEYDVANNRIRLKGQNVYPYNRNENATPWKEVPNG